MLRLQGSPGPGTPQSGLPPHREVPETGFSHGAHVALARVCREAGARVRFNAFLRDMNVNVAVTDERRIEVLAQDLPCFGGAQLAVYCPVLGNLTPTPLMWMAQRSWLFVKTKSEFTQS